MGEDMTCGCGRPVTYVTPSGDACNKYQRCLTYEELREALVQANRLIAAYRGKRAVDGLNGRTWSASEHYRAEGRIEVLEAMQSPRLKPKKG